MATFDPKAFINRYKQPTQQPAPQPAAPPVSQPAAQQAQPPVTQPSQAGGRGVIIPRQVSQEPSTEEIKRAEAVISNFNEIYKQGTAARQNSLYIKQLQSVLPLVQTGGVAALKKFLGQFGIESEGLSEIQLFDSLISKLVPQQRPPGSGVMSDADLALYRDSLPRLINVKGGNELIIESMKALNDYFIKESQIAEQYLLGKITADQASKMIQNIENPIPNFLEKSRKLSGDSGSSRFRVIGVRPVNPSGGQ